MSPPPSFLFNLPMPPIPPSVVVMPQMYLPPLELVHQILSDFFAREYATQLMWVLHPGRTLRLLQQHIVAKDPLDDMYCGMLLSTLAIAVRDSGLESAREASDRFAILARQVLAKTWVLEENGLQPSLQGIAFAHAMATLNNVMVFYVIVSDVREAFFHSGVAIRIMQTTGVHNIDDPRMQDSLEQRDEVQVEWLRRLWWRFFTSDRYAAVASGRPPGCDERTLHIRLPCDDALWFAEDVQAIRNNPAPLFDHSGSSFQSIVAWEQARPEAVCSPFALIVDLMALTSRISRYVCRPKSKSRPLPIVPGSDFDLFDQTLQYWQDNVDQLKLARYAQGLSVLPYDHRLRLDQPVLNTIRATVKLHAHLTFLKVLQQSTVILLHRSNLTMEEMPRQLNHGDSEAIDSIGFSTHGFVSMTTFSAQSLDRIYHAACDIVQLIKPSVGTIPAWANPPSHIESYMSYCIYAAALVFTDVSRTHSVDMAVREDARNQAFTCLAAIKLCAGQWGMAQRHTALLEQALAIQAE
jgi:hypothetical protein